MFKYGSLFAGGVVLAILAVAIPGRTTSPAFVSGAWVLDGQHSDAQYVTDGTTDFGKTKMVYTIGYAKMAGIVKLDSSDPTKSSFDFTTYPASSEAPPMNEDGMVKPQWLGMQANHTLVCFHSKGVAQNPDGRLQTTGNLVLTRVDRNVELTPNEAYSGPEYGPPIFHRIIRQATFVFDAPSETGGGSNGTGLQTSGSTNVVREEFPQLLKAVTGTYWPPVVQDKHCQVPAANEGYSGAQCTGTFLTSQPLPQPPRSAGGEDYPGPANFNAVVGTHMTILVHMRLTPEGSGGKASAGN
jgi:polyisoprenoid-binding protein YceI